MNTSATESTAIASAWEPQTLRDQRVVNALSIGIKVGFDLPTHLPDRTICAILGAALQRDEPSLTLRLHAALLTHFAADPIADRAKIEATLALMTEVLAEYEARRSTTAAMPLVMPQTPANVPCGTTRSGCPA